MFPHSQFVLPLVAAVCFALSAWRRNTPDWNLLVSVGLMFLAAGFIAW
jgi:hypothetical protein